MDADLDLGRALVAAPGWVWREGMRSVWSQLPEHGGNRTTFRAGNDRAYTDPWFQPERGRWTCDGPDLDDPATAGVIVGMLAATGRLHHIDSPRTNGRGWLVVIFDGAPGSEAFADTSLGRAAARAWLGVSRG